MTIKEAMEKANDLERLVGEIATPDLDSTARIEKAGAMKEAIGGLKNCIEDANKEKEDLVKKLYDAVLSPGSVRKEQVEDPRVGKFDGDAYAKDWLERNAEKFAMDAKKGN